MWTVRSERQKLKGLKIGVDRHELDPGDLSFDHPVDRVDAAAADADHTDHRSVRNAGIAGRRRFVAAVARTVVVTRRGLGEDPAQPVLRVGSTARVGAMLRQTLLYRLLGNGSVRRREVVRKGSFGYRSIQRVTAAKPSCGGGIGRAHRLIAGFRRSLLNNLFA